MSYFAHSYCSNSDLSQLARDLTTADAVEYRDAYRMGTLVHAMVLEPEKVDHYKLTVAEYSYTPAEFQLARSMARSVNSDLLTATIKRHCEFEKEMYVDQVRFGNIALDCRCKYDAWAPVLGYGFDLKTTTARTQAEFLAAARRFSYPRARVFYCTIAGASRDIIIGVSKHPPHRIFKIFLAPGDLLWKEGEAELLDLTMKYWALKIPA